MTKEIRSPNVEKLSVVRSPVSSFGFRHSDFVIRHSDLRDSSVATVAARIRRLAPETPAAGCRAPAHNGPDCTSGIFLPKPSEFPPAHRRDAAVPPPPLP